MDTEAKIEIKTEIEGFILNGDSSVGTIYVADHGNSITSKIVFITSMIDLEKGIQFWSKKNYCWYTDVEVLAIIKNHLG